MTNTETSAPYGLSDDSWENARALTMAAEIRCGTMATNGLRSLVQYAEDMVRRLIMLMAAAINVSAPAKRRKSSGELQAMIDEVNALLRGGVPKTEHVPPAPKVPSPPSFKWRKAERSEETDPNTITDEPRPALTTSNPPNYNRRITALMHAITYPETYARKAAKWLAQRAEPEAQSRKARPWETNLLAPNPWDNMFIQMMAQLSLKYGPEIWDSS